jgi:hypothetical protein
MTEGDIRQRVKEILFKLDTGGELTSPHRKRGS